MKRIILLLPLITCGRTDVDGETDAGTDTDSPTTTDSGGSSTSSTTTDGTDSATSTSVGSTTTVTDMGVMTQYCDDYCALVTANCTGQYSQYEDGSECLSYCNAWAPFPEGSPNDLAGNTFGCRTFHAQQAQAAPRTFCSHAGLSGGDVCGTWCDVYCDLVALNCMGVDQLFADDVECMSACARFDDSGSQWDIAGNTVQCRISHAAHAGNPNADVAPERCPHASEDSAVCQ